MPWTYNLLTNLNKTLKYTANNTQIKQIKIVNTSNQNIVPRTLGNLVISIVKNELNIPNMMILNLTIKNITLKNSKKDARIYQNLLHN